jgi:hypothetical protein
LGDDPQFLLLVMVEAGRCEHERNLPLAAGLRDLHRGGRYREVDHGIDGMREVGGEGHADRPDARQIARVFAEVGIVGSVESGGNLHLGIGRAEGQKPAAHAAVRAVDGDAELGHGEWYLVSGVWQEPGGCES